MLAKMDARNISRGNCLRDDVRGIRPGANLLHPCITGVIETRSSRRGPKGLFSLLLLLISLCCYLSAIQYIVFRFIVWQKISVVTGRSTLVLLANATTTIVEQKSLSGKSQRTGIACTCAYIYTRR